MQRGLGIGQTPIETPVQNVDSRTCEREGRHIATTRHHPTECPVRRHSFDTLGKCSCGDPKTYSSTAERRAHSATHDLPEGYRWATEEEMDHPDAIVVKRTADSNGWPYTQDEADIAIPVTLPLFKVEVLVEIRATDGEAAYQKVADLMGKAWQSSQEEYEATPWHYEMLDDCVTEPWPIVADDNVSAHFDSPPAAESSES